jgi:hypothetical protein
MQNKVHEFSIKIRFDRACSREFALKAIRDNIYGEFYTDNPVAGFWEKAPEEFKVKTIKSIPRRKNNGA